MSAEAASYNDWSPSNASSAQEDKWHVALAPNEVKIVSLEQLDDLFRLSIVDAETPVWQAGMGDWLPLRVIAGIDDEDDEEPQLATRRAQPKPAPKPPTPTRRPAPPQRRPAEMLALAATQPASFYPAAVAAAPAPASFYPTAVSVAPVAAASYGFAAPAQQFNSVRPLVVSRAPIAPARGGGFGRFLVGLAVVAGVGISLYRNDVLRDAAHSAHQDALYARLERALGGPASDTMRAFEQSTGSQSAALSSDEVAVVPTTAASGTRSGAASAEPPATTAASLTAGSTPPVVSLESLTPEKKAGAAGAAAPLPAPVAVSPAVPVAARAVTSSPSISHAASAAPVARAASAAPAPRPAKSAPAPKAEKPVLAPEKSESQMTEREKLNAAIGRSMLSTPPSSKSKSKSKASEYDPLNPTL